MSDAEAPELSHDRKYTALVSASSPEEAAEIAAEALTHEFRIVRTDIEDVSASEGKDSYRVTLWYEGGKRGGQGTEGN